MISIGSLFAGIGLLELGVLAAFEEAGHDARIVAQVEIDPYRRAVLERHFPDADRSVTDVRAASASNLPRCDVIVGGFPCKQTSSAGSREGLSGKDSRLWFEYLRVVRELRPAIVIVENVESGLRRWLGPVACGLRGAGYHVPSPIGVSAADVGAPHIRKRVFVVAYAVGVRELQPQGRECGVGRWACDGGHVGDSDVARLSRRQGERRDPRPEFAPSIRAGGTLDDANSARCERAATREERAGGDGSLGPGDGGGIVEAQPGLGRDAHGRAARLDAHRWPAGRGAAQESHEPPRTVEGRHEFRRARLSALGDSCTPQQALVVGRIAVRNAFGRAA